MRTLEIPDDVFRRAEAAAARRGIPLHDLVTEAIIARIGPHPGQEKSWMKAFGKLRDLKDETARITQVVDEAFEQIEVEDMK